MVHISRPFAGLHCFHAMEQAPWEQADDRSIRSHDSSPATNRGAAPGSAGGHLAAGGTRPSREHISPQAPVPHARCIPSEHEQGCGGDARRGGGICAPASQEDRSAGCRGGVHEAHAGEEEEQREALEEAEGVVAPDPGSSCAALEAAGHQEMEIQVEVEMSLIRVFD